MTDRALQDRVLKSKRRTFAPKHAREKANGLDQDAGTHDDKLCLTLEQWAQREIPPRDFLLGSIFTTTTRGMLSADTGLGKTQLGFALGFAMADGADFCHWRGHRKARVLIVDGEMSRELVKERLADAERRFGQRPAKLRVLCKEDAPSLPPLDTEAGQDWFDQFITQIDGLDFLILDNVMALTAGDLKDEEAWKPVVTWMRSLTKRRIGVLWINHTGHDSTRSYGTKTREWQLDTVMVGTKVEGDPADIAMQITFTKARQRCPATRDEYEPVTIRLAGDVWEASAARSAKRMPKDTEVVRETLAEAIASVGKDVPPVGDAVPPKTIGVTVNQWRMYYYRRSPLDVDDGDDEKAKKKVADARKKRFQRAREALQEAKIIQFAGDWAWFIK